DDQRRRDAARREHGSRRVSAEGGFAALRRQARRPQSRRDTVAPMAQTFSDLGLDDALVRALTTLGYEVPTPIQERTIPVLLKGRDVIGQAQTGTGKTAAFSLPLLQQIDSSRNETQALILTPTRELAVQVAEAIHSYAQNLHGVSVLPVYGGA